MRGLLIAITMLAASSVQARSYCTSYQNMVDHLTIKYQEVLSGIGTTRGGESLLEIHVSEAGTYTILHRAASGLTCIIAAGHNWEDIKPQPPEIKS